MNRKIELELRMPDNKFQIFTQDFVAYEKRHDYARLETELQEAAEKENRFVEESEYEELQAAFVADLFESKEVTKELILKGLDTLDRGKIVDIIRYRVMGFNKADDEAAKKAMAEEILNGATSTSSN